MASGKAVKSTAPVALGGLDTFKYKHTPEDADALALEILPATIMTDFGDANWKTRLASLEELTTWVETEIETLDAEVLVRALAKKGWAEKNFQVCVDFVSGTGNNAGFVGSGIFQALWYLQHLVSAMSQLRKVLRSSLYPSFE